MKTTKHCAGCRDNFYNQPGNSTTGKCWSLPSAKFVTKWRLSIHTPMNIKSAYVKVKVPDCYREPGYVHLNKVPDYAV